MKRKALIAIALLAVLGLIGGCAASNEAEQNSDASNTESAITQETSANTDTADNSQAETSERSTMQESIEATQARVTLNGKGFIIDLADNETARAFAGLLPMEAQMSELNGNEKYIRLDRALPSAASSFATIEAGDVMLYQDDYIVVFYETHPTSYSYTRIGKITDITGLADAVGSGFVGAEFELV